MVCNRPSIDLGTEVWILVMGLTLIGSVAVDKCFYLMIATGGLSPSFPNSVFFYIQCRSLGPPMQPLLATNTTLNSSDLKTSTHRLQSSEAGSPLKFLSSQTKTLS